MQSTTAERKRVASEERERAKRRRPRERGLVLIGWAARWLKTDRRQLVKLHEAGVLPGEPLDGSIALDRRALAAWAWSRPRCVADGCDRRVLRDGLGCTQHPNHGKRHTSETRQKMSQRTHERWGTQPSTRLCEACGEPLRRGAKRFHRHCADHWLHIGEGATERHLIRDAAQREWSALREVKRAELERDGYIVGLDAIARAMPTTHRRSAAALSKHIATGRLSVLRLEDLRLIVVDPDELGSYVRALDDADGRLQRFNATTAERARWRAGVWTKHRHGDEASEREFGWMAPVLAAADGKRPGRPPMKRPDGSQVTSDELDQVAELLASPEWSQAKIAIRFGVSRDQVKRYAAALKKLGETPLLTV